MSNNPYDWIYDNGGSALRLRLLLKHSVQRPSTEVESIVSDLLSMEEVQRNLSYMEGFHIQVSAKKEMEHLIHYYGDKCIDN